jgi:hypothetical protein
MYIMLLMAKGSQTRNDASPGLSQDEPILCTVELYGTARLHAKTAKVALVLPPRAVLSSVFVALAGQLPVLVGPVIAPDRSKLTSGHACNINGRDFVRDPKFKINPGDSIIIISNDAGG